MKTESNEVSWNRKRTCDKNRENVNKLWALVNNNIGSLIVTNTSHKCKMLIIEGNGCGVYGDSVLSLQFFCKSITVLKLSVFFKSEGS